MHMADALLSPAVGGAMWAASAGTIAYCSAKVRQDPDDHKVPLMGVLGAFIFAAQMINFTIPATGSSGHLAGGMILAMGSISTRRAISSLKGSSWLERVKLARVRLGSSRYLCTVCRAIPRVLAILRTERPSGTGSVSCNSVFVR